jgi:hypothetical protein
LYQSSFEELFLAEEFASVGNAVSMFCVSGFLTLKGQAITSEEAARTIQAL